MYTLYDFFIIHIQIHFLSPRCAMFLEVLFKGVKPNINHTVFFLLPCARVTPKYISICILCNTTNTDNGKDVHGDSFIIHVLILTNFFF